jgi:hypothetical protein
VIEHGTCSALGTPPDEWIEDDVAEYRAFDRSGVIIDQQTLEDTDAAVAWGIAVVVQQAALVERKDGDDWVCFREYHAQKSIPAQLDR